MKSIYLAGTITGIKCEDAVNWRKKVKKELAKNFLFFDPTDGIQEVFDDNEIISLAKSHANRKIFGDFFAKDIAMLDKSDIVVFNFDKNCKNVGGLVEFGYCAKAGKDIYVITQDNYLHRHDFINRFAKEIFYEVDFFIDKLKKSPILA